MKHLFLLLLCLPIHAAQFYDGSADFNSLAGNPSQDFTGGVTMSVWFRRIAGSAVLDQGLFTKGRRLFAGEAQYCLGLNGGKARFWYANPNTTLQTWQTTAGFPQTNLWNHIVVKYTYGTASSIRMFVNGVDTAGSWVEGAGTVAGLTNAVTLKLASSTDSSTLFNGFMSEFALWNTALTDAQCRLLYSKVKFIPLQIAPANLVAYWPKDDGRDAKSNTDRSFAINRQGDRRNNFNSIGIGQSERVNSYYPNE